MSIHFTVLAAAKALALACLVLISSTALAVGPGTGSLNKGSMTIGNCQAADVTATWRLDSLVGEPMVKGSFKWTGDSECKLPTSTIVWLEITNGSQKGYVKLPLDEVPKANAGFGRDMSRSPNWAETICSYSGTTSTDCYDADQAKSFWKNGNVTSFTVKWNPADVKAIEPKPSTTTSSSSGSTAAKPVVASPSYSSTPRSTQQTQPSGSTRSASTSSSTRSTTSATSSSGTDYATEYSRQSEEANRRHMAEVNEQMRRQRAIDAQRQQNIDRSAQDMANLAVMASQMDIPKPMAVVGGALFGGFVAGAVLMPQNEEGEVAGQPDFNYNPFFTSTFIALTGATAYFRFADIGPTKLTNVQVLKSQYGLGDREQFLVTSKEDTLEGFRLSTAKYMGRAENRNGLVIWTDISSEKSSEAINYAVKNDGNTLFYSTKKHMSINGGVGYWRENPSGLIWALGVMPFSTHLLDDHGYTRLGGFLYGELDTVDSEESLNFLDMFGPIRGEIVKDRLTLSAIYDAQSGTSSFGLGYTWR